MAEQKADKFQEIIAGLTSQDRNERLLAIRALGIVKIPKYADSLKDLLASPDEEIVENSLEALGKIKNPASIKYIIEFILDDYAKLSTKSYEILKEYDCEALVNELLKYTNAEQPPEIRCKLLRLIRKCKDVRVTSLMHEVLGQTTNTCLLTETIKYFIKFPSSECHTALKMLSSNKDWQVSLAANLALSRLKDESAFAHIKRLIKSPNTEIRKFIVNSLNEYQLIQDRKIYKIALNDNVSEIREIALKGLALFASDERIVILKERLNSEQDNKIRKILLSYAAKEKNGQFLDEFIKIMSETEEMKIMAVNAIADMGKKVIDVLIDNFNSYPLVIKEQLVITLGKINDEKAVNIIKDCLTAKHRWLKINAIDAVVNMKNEELITLLADMLKAEDTDSWVRATLISAFGKLGDNNYADIISLNLNNSDARVRANTIEALSALAWPKLEQACKSMLKDRNDRVRVNAALALWKCGNSEILTELEQMTTDKSKWVRASAVFALGKIADKEKTPLLISMLQDKEDVVYINTVSALANMGDIRALIPLIKESVSGRFPKNFYDEYLEIFSQNLHK